MKLVLVNKKKETGNIISFLFKPEKNISWKSGQFLIYTLPHSKEDLRGIQRFFTISSAPHEKHIMLSTRMSDKPSSFKYFLNKLKIGDNVEVKGPDGDFTIDDNSKNHVFIAGGTGINPFRSIILDLIYKKIPLNFTLLYSSPDFPFKDELNIALENFSDSKIYYFKKEISKKNLEKYVKDKNSIFYVCGPDAMVDEITDTLEKLGIQKENIRQDYFSGY